MSGRRGRPASVVLVAVVVALVLLVGVAASGQAATSQAGNESNATVAPGHQLGAVVDVGQAELETEVEGRAFTIAVANADTPAATARVIKERADDLERRIDALENRFDSLSAARGNGSLSVGGYRARTAGLAARLAGVARLANASAAASAGLPADVLAANGVDVGALEGLRQRASELGGDEVARIAREIAGPDVGSPPGRPAGVPAPPVTPGGPPNDAPGGPDTATADGPGTDRAGG